MLNQKVGLDVYEKGRQTTKSTIWTNNHRKLNPCKPSPKKHNRSCLRSTWRYPCTTTTTSTDTSQQGKQNEKTEWPDKCTLMHPMKPNHIPIPDNNITKPATYSTREGKTQKGERLLVFLPLGGGKLRCRHVLGLGSGRGSCLNPGGKGDQGIGRRWSNRRQLDKPFCSG